MRAGNRSGAYGATPGAFSFDEDMTADELRRFDALGERQTTYALEALQNVFARMPWGTVFEFSDGRRGRIEPFVEPRWTRDGDGSTDLVEGGFDVKFLDGGHVEFWVTQSGWESVVRAKNPQAKREHLDMVTGARVKPGSPGSIDTGRYVMRVRPAPGEPFQVVEVDREDLDPNKDSFGVARETFGEYSGVAARQAKAQARALKKMPTFERGQEPKIPGTRETFDSPQQALEVFLTHNPSLWVVDWADVHDGVRDWMDRVQMGKRGKRFNQTARGQEILELFERGRDTKGLHELLLYIFGQAKKRRWDEVQWEMVDDLVEVFADAARDYVDHGGAAGDIQGGVPAVVWMPPVTGFRSSSKEFVNSLDARGQEYFRRYQASQDLFGLAKSLKKMLRQNRKCLSAEERRVVRSRIKTIEKWAERPDEMPEWACASFREPTAICDLLGIHTELEKLRDACEVGYDPRWAVGDAGDSPLAPGLGVLPEAAEFVAGDPEDLDLPWETAANPRARRKRVSRR